MKYNKDPLFEVIPGTFLSWLLNQRDRDSPIGDLAADMYRDSNFPGEDVSVERMYAYVRFASGDTDIANIVLEAYREWGLRYPSKLKRKQKTGNHNAAQSVD